MKTFVTKGKAVVELAFYGILALALSSCGTLATGSIPVGVSPAPIAASTAIDEQAWYAMETSYNVPAQAYVAALDTGALPDGVKSRVKPKLVKLNQLRTSARSAYKAGNSTNFFALAAEMKTLSDSAKTLLGIPVGDK